MDKMNNSEKKEHSKSSSKTIEQKLEAMGMEDYELFLKRAYGSKDPDVCNDTDQEQEHNLLLDELQRQVTVKDDISKAKPLDQGSRKQSTHHASNTSTFSSPYDVKTSTSPLTSPGYRSLASYGVDNKSINLNNNVRTLNGVGGVTTITSNSLISSCSSSSSSSSSSHSANNNYSSSSDEQATKAFENDLQNNAYFTNEVSEISGSPYIRANLDSPPETSSFHRPTTPILHPYPFQLGDGKNVTSLLTNGRERPLQSQNSSQLGLVDITEGANGTGRGPDNVGVPGLAGLGGTIGGHSTAPIVNNHNERFGTKKNDRLEKAQKKKDRKAQKKETVVTAEDLPGYMGEQTLEDLLIFLDAEDALKQKEGKQGKKKDGNNGKKKEKSKEKEALVKSASLDESHLNSNKKRAVASESSVGAGSSSSVAATMAPSPTATTPDGSYKSSEKKNSSSENAVSNPSLPNEVVAPSLVEQRSITSNVSGSVAAHASNGAFSASPTSGAPMVNGAGSALPSANRKTSGSEGFNGSSSPYEDERFGRDDIFEAPFELVQNKKKKPKKSITQREAETFSRGNANDHARREQARARRNVADRRKSVGSVPGSENEASDDDSVRSLPAVQCLNLLILTKAEQQQRFIRQSPQEVIVAVAKVETTDETPSTNADVASTNAVAAVPNGTAEEVVPASPESASNSTSRPRNPSVSSGGTTDMPVIFCGNNFEREIPVVREDLGFEFGFFDGMRENAVKPEDGTATPVENVAEAERSTESPVDCLTVSMGTEEGDISESTPERSEESRQQFEDGTGGDAMIEDEPAHGEAPSAGKSGTDSMNTPVRGDKSSASRSGSSGSSGGMGRESLLGTYRGPPVHTDRRTPQNPQYSRGARTGMSSGQPYRGQNRNGSTPPVMMYPHYVPNTSHSMQPNPPISYGPHHPMMQIAAGYSTPPPPQGYAPVVPPQYAHHPQGPHPQRGMTIVQPAGFIPPIVYNIPPPMSHQPPGTTDDGSSSGGISTAPHLMTTAQLQGSRFMVNPRMITTPPQPPPGIEGPSMIPGAQHLTDTDGYPLQYQMQTVSVMMPLPNPSNPVPMMYCSPMPAIHIPTPAMEIESWMNSQVQRVYNLEQQGQLQIHRVNEL